MKINTEGLYSKYNRELTDEQILEYLNEIENDVYRHAYLHLLHENEQLKNELWKAKERLKRLRNEGGNAHGLYVSSVSRIER